MMVTVLVAVLGGEQDSLRSSGSPARPNIWRLIILDVVDAHPCYVSPPIRYGFRLLR